MSNQSKSCDSLDVFGSRHPINPLFPPQSNAIDVKLMSKAFWLATSCSIRLRCNAHFRRLHTSTQAVYCNCPLKIKMCLFALNEMVNLPVPGIVRGPGVGQSPHLLGPADGLQIGLAPGNVSNLRSVCMRRRACQVTSKQTSHP